VLLRGTALALEALTLGGILYFLVIARPLADEVVLGRLQRWIRYAAVFLACTYAVVVAVNTAILINSTDLKLGDVVGAGFWIAGILVVAGASMIAIFARSRWLPIVSPIAFVSIVAGSVMASHSVARLEHRWLLIISTLVHHVAGAAWIGGLPYLLVSLRRTSNLKAASAMTARFSKLAIASVSLLLAAGLTLGFLYVGSIGALGETTYGVMLLSKVFLTAVLLLFGALNLRVVRAVAAGAGPSMLPLRRFAEVEVGIGYTVLLAAASLTSTPPAIDVSVDRVSPQQIVQRMSPRWPRLDTPPLSALSPASPLSIPQDSALPGSFVPGQLKQPNNPADIAWSEYNHHWAGLIVLAIGILAVLSRRLSWARHWPLMFFGLAIFLLVRSDSENWPLGPRGFWESFQVAEVAQHRVFVLLIVAFGVFEWAVQTGHLSPRRAGLVFPLVCAVGGALLMTHSHSLGNVKEEFLVELSHIPLGIAAVIAGWMRWLEIRLPDKSLRLVSWIWPICFVVIGSVLICYRES